MAIADSGRVVYFPPGNPEDPEVAAACAERAAVCEEIISQFRLDVREDQQALDGASIDQARRIVLTIETRPGPNEADLSEDQDPDPERRRARWKIGLACRYVFLFVDEEVLRGFETATAITASSELVPESSDEKLPPWIKVVEIDYDPKEHRGNSRTGGERFFGWMMMTTRSIIEMWIDMYGRN